MIFRKRLHRKERSELLTLHELLALSSSEVTDEDLITVVTGALDHLPIYQLILCLPWSSIGSGMRPNQSDCVILST